MGSKAKCTEPTIFAASPSPRAAPTLQFSSQMPWQVRHIDASVGQGAHGQSDLGPTSAPINRKNEFVNLIYSQNMHPKDAASRLGMQMELVNRNGGTECSVRLSKKHRLYFVFNEGEQVVEITQIGGHD